jgi:hypothetical protein
MIENAGEITSALTRRAIVERFSAAMAGTTRKTLPLEAIRRVSRYAASGSETTVGKFGDRGRYVTTEDGAKIFLTTDGQIGRTGKNIDGGPASPEPPAEPELRAGQKLTVPQSTSFGEFIAKLTDEGDGRLGLHRDEEKSYPIVKFNPEKMRTLLDDLSGKIRLPGPSGNPSIDRVAAGQAKFLGRGNDGLAFDTGDGNVVKVSSQFYFHWMQNSREPQQAIEHTRRGYEIGTKLRQAGVPGIVPQEYFEHGGRAFLTMPKLDTSAKITPEHVEQVRQTVKGMLDAGYGLNDEIQVGIGADGRAYVFDLGQADKIESKYQRENNEEAFKSFAEKNGVKDVDVDAASRFDDAMLQAEEYVGKWEKRGYATPPIAKIILDDLGNAWSKAIKAAPEMTELYEDAYWGIVNRLDAIPKSKPTAAV